jgi:hypothetical protein
MTRNSKSVAFLLRKESYGLSPKLYWSTDLSSSPRQNHRPPEFEERHGQRKEDRAWETRNWFNFNFLFQAQHHSHIVDTPLSSPTIESTHRKRRNWRCLRQLISFNWFSLDLKHLYHLDYSLNYYSRHPLDQVQHERTRTGVLQRATRWKNSEKWSSWMVSLFSLSTRFRSVGVVSIDLCRVYESNNDTRFALSIVDSIELIQLSSISLTQLSQTTSKYSRITFYRSRISYE